MQHICYYNAPIGMLRLIENGKGLTGIQFAFGAQYQLNRIEPDTDLLKEAVKQLREYFDGERKSFSLPLEPKGTDFQLRTWDALQQIPYGETRTYKQIAETIGCPKGCRAVGLANNRNPLPIIIPCHRVIGTNGHLVGYAGGLEVKQQLLELERNEPKG